MIRRLAYATACVPLVVAAGAMMVALKITYRDYR